MKPNQICRLAVCGSLMICILIIDGCDINLGGATSNIPVSNTPIVKKPVAPVVPIPDVPPVVPVVPTPDIPPVAPVALTSDMNVTQLDLSALTSDIMQYGYAWNNLSIVQFSDNYDGGYDSTMWTNNQVREAMLNYMGYFNPTNTYFLHLQITNLSYGEANAYITGVGNDDALWGALAMIRSYELDPSKNGNYLTLAKSAFDWVYQDYDNNNGGVWWQHNFWFSTPTDSSYYKNTITNELFLEVALKLYKLDIVNQSYYAPIIDKEVQWFFTSVGNSSSDYNSKLFNIHDKTKPLACSLINNSGLFVDGYANSLTKNVGSNFRVYTYNQGVILDVLSRLSSHYNDPRYKNLANSIINSVINTMSPASILSGTYYNMNLSNNHAVFKGIFMRYLGYYLIDNYEAKSMFCSYIESNVMAIFAGRVSDAKGRFIYPYIWDSTQETIYKQGGNLLTNISALDLFNTAQGACGMITEPSSVQIINNNGSQILGPFLQSCIVENVDKATHTVNNSLLYTYCKTNVAINSYQNYSFKFSGLSLLSGAFYVNANGTLSFGSN